MASTGGGSGHRQEQYDQYEAVRSVELLRMHQSQQGGGGGAMSPTAGSEYGTFGGGGGGGGGMMPFR